MIIIINAIATLYTKWWGAVVVVHIFAVERKDFPSPMTLFMWMRQERENTLCGYKKVETKINSLKHFARFLF